MHIDVNIKEGCFEKIYTSVNTSIPMLFKNIITTAKQDIRMITLKIKDKK